MTKDPKPKPKNPKPSSPKPGDATKDFKGGTTRKGSTKPVKKA